MATRNSHGRTLLLRKFQARNDAEYFSRTGRLRPLTDSVIDGTVDVYTDGSASQGRAGCGVFFGTNSPRNIACAFPFDNHTNNRAELYAIYLAICAVSDMHPRRLRIHTDSRYSINALTTWRDAWTRTSFKDNTIANRELVEMVWARMDTVSFAIEFVWVRGHAGSHGNHGADALANAGRALVPTTTNNTTTT